MGDIMVRLGFGGSAEHLSRFDGSAGYLARFTWLLLALTNFMLLCFSAFALVGLRVLVGSHTKSGDARRRLAPLRTFVLSMETISALDTSAGGDRTCSICLSDLEVGENVTELCCHHFFHADCIGCWLDAHSECPMRCVEADAAQAIDVYAAPSGPGVVASSPVCAVHAAAPADPAAEGCVCPV